MREILFRGKRKDNGEWVEGWFCGPCNIVNTSWGYDELLECEAEICNDYAVIPETVGQYTGLDDKNGKMIFEGDILYRTSSYIVDGEFAAKERYEGVVKYGAFNCTCCDGVYGWYINDGDIRSLDERCNNNLYVIGNIHDNPELLEVDNG